MSKTTVAQRARWALGALTLSVLTACGGGGGSDGTGSESLSNNGPATLTAANAEDAARAAMAAASMADLSSGLSTALFGSSGQQVVDIARRAHAMAVSAQALRQRALATDTVSCDGGGSMTVSVGDRNGNSLIDAVGESLTISGSNCNLGDGALLNGGLTVTLASYTDASNYGMTLAFSGFSVQETSTGNSVTVSGSLSSSLSNGTTFAVESSQLDLTSRITGAAATVSVSALQAAIEAQGSGTSTTVSGTVIAAGLGSRSVTLSTPVGFYTASSDTYPSSGELKIVGAGGSNLLISALDATQVQVWVDANGDGLYESSQTYNWSDLQ